MVLEREALSAHQLAGIGVAAPGQVDMKIGSLEFGPGLGLRGVPFASHLSDAFMSVPVRVDNDARCATRAELRLGVGRMVNSFACIFIGTGVGSGLVLGGHIYNGENMCAGEIGHTTINFEGPLCKCGRRGCLEVYINGPAIARRAAKKVTDCQLDGRPTLLSEVAQSDLDSEAVADAVGKGDQAAREVVTETSQLLGEGLANYLNAFDLGTIVLGGGVMDGLFQYMIDDIQRKVRDDALDQVKFRVTRVHHMATGAMIGLALLFHPDEKWLGGGMTGNLLVLAVDSGATTIRARLAQVGLGHTWTTLAEGSSSSGSVDELKRYIANFAHHHLPPDSRIDAAVIGVPGRVSDDRLSASLTYIDPNLPSGFSDLFEALGVRIGLSSTTWSAVLAECGCWRPRRSWIFAATGPLDHSAPSGLYSECRALGSAWESVWRRTS